MITWPTNPNIGFLYMLVTEMVALEVEPLELHPSRLVRHVINLSVIRKA